MGGVFIALVDTLGDPWSNPAKATRLTSGSLQVMPFTHHATAGGGRTLALSILQTGGSFAGGALFSMQEVERTHCGVERARQRPTRVQPVLLRYCSRTGSATDFRSVPVSPPRT